LTATSLIDMVPLNDWMTPTFTLAAAGVASPVPVPDVVLLSLPQAANSNPATAALAISAFGADRLWAVRRFPMSSSTVSTDRISADHTEVPLPVREADV
jgi:hypothetical protein